MSVIVPVLNGMRYLPATLPSILAAAAEGSQHVEVIYVDNGSTDGTLEFLQSHSFSGLRVLRVSGGSIAALRNAGARVGRGEHLSFLDADCVIERQYFASALATLTESGASATGCETEIPGNPHWIERAWHDMHYVGRDRDVHYLNSANFFVKRAAFERIGGFREDLVTGEDSEIGQRLLDAGMRIRESTRVGAVHLGNPKSLRTFYRRTVWHGLGMFGTTTLRRMDRPTAMMLLHLAASAAGVAALFAESLPMGGRIAAFVTTQLLAPALTVLFRMAQTGRMVSLVSAVALYWLYYWARIQALGVIVLGWDSRYRK